MKQAFIGVDVGTSSARAGVFDETGTLLATARHPITVWHEAGSVVEQSSAEIWAACAASVRDRHGGGRASCFRRQGHRLRCDLLARGARRRRQPADGQRIRRRHGAMSSSGWTIAPIAEARLVNDTHDDVLRYVGGSISPEMEIPKLLWLKRHLPSTYRSAGHFFDLADYLSFRATGSTARSMCTLACKWNYLAHEQRWSGSYFERIGLGDLAADNYARIGNEIVAPGTAAGPRPDGIRRARFRLARGNAGRRVADRCARRRRRHDRGARQSGQAVDVCRRLAYIMGTSACIMATTSAPRFVPGVWGPYYSGMVPGFWLNEGGQSAAGAAIDHLVRSHPAHDEAVAAAHAGRHGNSGVSRAAHRLARRKPGRSRVACP